VDYTSINQQDMGDLTSHKWGFNPSKIDGIWLIYHYWTSTRSGLNHEQLGFWRIPPC
jgi:hypothetical protein